MHLSTNDRESLGSGSNSSKKEGTLSIPQWLLQSRENSDSGSMPSFDIILPQLVKYFNENKEVPHEYSEQMRQAMLKSGICFVPLTTDDGYLNIVVLEKDKDAFLQVQNAVFQKEKEREHGKLLQKESTEQELELEEMEM